VMSGTLAVVRHALQRTFFEVMTCSAVAAVYADIGRLTES